MSSPEKSGSKSTPSDQSRSSNQKKQQRRTGLQPMGQMVTKAAYPTLKRQGFTLADLIIKWPHIIGDRLAAICQPHRLVFPRGERMNGVLYCQALGAWALELQHQSPLVIQRINTFFGYKAVARLSLSQGYFDSLWQTDKKTTPETVDLTQMKVDDKLEPHLSQIQNQELRDALHSLAYQLTHKKQN